MGKKERVKTDENGDAEDINSFRKMIKKHGPNKVCEILEEKLLRDKENKSPED